MNPKGVQKRAQRVFEHPLDSLTLPQPYFWPVTTVPGFWYACNVIGGAMAASAKSVSDRKPTRYQIKIEGNIREDWSDWLSGMNISSAQDGKGSQITTLTGIVPDQAALRGILCKLWDLNLTILSVARIEKEGQNE
jgi:hypothetical protein